MPTDQKRVKKKLKRSVESYALYCGGKNPMTAILPDNNNNNTKKNVMPYLPSLVFLVIISFPLHRGHFRIVSNETGGSGSR